ncbi:MAG: hypothetical protein IJ214_09705 [Clostridia bacterium]|nr:hypothetical protein [Clostridia bacterium]
MKKRAFCLLLSLALLACVSAQADRGGSFYRRLQYGTLSAYENFVYHYSLKIFNRFETLPDEMLELLWQHMDEEHTEDSDEIYDIRIWFSPDSRYQFEAQVKEQTYASFDIEIAKAPEYLDLVRDGYPEDSNVRMIHDGILRATPAGDMLEIALAYDSMDENGSLYTTVFVYYDIYRDGVEYCFSMYAYDGDYNTAQAMLDEICQTVELAPSGVPA